LASNRIDVRIEGKDNTKGAFSSAAKGAETLGNSVSKASQTANKELTATQQAILNIGKTGRASGQTVASSMGIGTTAINKLGSAASTVGSKISAAISKGSQTASSAIQKLGTTASATFSKISSGASKAGSSMDGISSAITGLAGSYGVAEIASDAWTGATQRQFNTAYLGTKMSTQAASDYVKTINQVVAAVPGDDTFMNTILTGAVARQTNLTTQEISSLGSAVADYLTVSTAMGKSQIETQMDLKEYISTGNTGQMERDSILKNQLSTLENQSTVSDRILALNKALTAEGYSGLSALDIASIKWESLKGKFQLALTNIGSAFLVIAEPVIDFFTMLDEKTNGASTTVMVLVAGAALLGAAFIGLLPILGSLMTSAGALVAILGIGLGPITLIILGITAAVAAGIYIWNTWSDKITETFGFLQSGNWGGVAANIGSAFNFIKDAVINAIAGIPAAIGNLGGTMVQIGNQLIQWLVSGLTNLNGWLDMQMQSMLTESGQSGGQGLVSGIMSWIDANGPTMVNSLVLIVTKLIPLLFQVGIKISMMLMQGMGQALGGLLGYLFGWIVAPFASAGSAVVSTWNWVKGIVTAALSAVTGFISWGSGAVSGTYNWLKGIVSQAISSVTSFTSWGSDAVYSTYNWLKSTVGNGIQSVVSFVTGSGPAGPRSPGNIAMARGPFDSMNLKYENYAGHKKNAWNGDNSMSGNCVDMSLGLISAAGSGQLISGTWNGGPHVWARIGGKDYDPARKALNGTWSPPARGPGDGYGNVVINGDIYGFDDFQKKVEQANNRMGMRVM
jgi:hypothetical protein